MFSFSFSFRKAVAGVGVAGLLAGMVPMPTAAAVPEVGMNGVCPNAWTLAQYVAANYPGVQAIGGIRPDRLPDHPSGHAIDIMIGSDMALGDSIAAFVRSNMGTYGVKYLLWRVPDHFNHVHVTVF